MIKLSLIFLIIFLRSFKLIILSFFNKDMRYEFFRKLFQDNNDFVLVGKGPGFISEYKLVQKYAKSKKVKNFNRKVISLNGSTSKQVKVDLILYELCNWRDHLSHLSNIYKNKHSNYPILLHGNIVPKKVWKSVKNFLKIKFLDFTIWEKIPFFSRLSLEKEEYFNIFQSLYFLIKKLKLPLFIWLRASLPSLIIFLALNSKCRNIFIVGCPMSDGIYKKQKKDVISMIEALELSFFIAEKAGKTIRYVVNEKTNPAILSSKYIKTLKINF